MAEWLKSVLETNDANGNSGEKYWSIGCCDCLCICFPFLSDDKNCTGAIH